MAFSSRLSRVEDRRRQRRLRHHGKPQRGLESGKPGLGHGRHIGHRGDAMIGRHRERVDLALAHERQAGPEHAEADVDAALGEIENGRTIGRGRARG